METRQLRMGCSNQAAQHKRSQNIDEMGKVDEFHKKIADLERQLAQNENQPPMEAIEQEKRKPESIIQILVRKFKNSNFFEFNLPTVARSALNNHIFPTFNFWVLF